MLQTKYNRNPSRYESGGGERLVETAGYIPAKQRIEALILAGHRLDQWRRDQFDFCDSDPDLSFYDPTRLRNFDIIDADYIDREVRAKYRKTDKIDKQSISDLSEGIPQPLAVGQNE